jgi:hypothetical protein
MGLSNSKVAIFLDKLLTSYPLGITKESLVSTVPQQSSITGKVRCIVFVDSETKPGGEEYNFVAAVCEKGLELRVGDYRLKNRADIGRDIQNWLKTTSASIVISFENDHRDVRGKTLGTTTYIQAPDVKTVSSSVEQKRLLWAHLKPLRMSQGSEDSVNHV